VSAQGGFGTPSVAVGRGQTNEAPAPLATLADQLNTVAQLNNRLLGVRERLVNSADALYGATPSLPRTNQMDEPPNGVGIVRTLNALLGLAHDTVTRLEEQVERLERAVG
jgi:hypothetical protein